MEWLKQGMKVRGYRILSPITKGWSSDQKFVMSDREIPLWYERYKNR